MISEFMELAKLSAKFQAIEITIKIFLVQQEIEKDKKSNEVKDGYSVALFDDFPLGPLLRRFKNVCDDTDLYDRLMILKSYRNMIAHKSFLLAYPGFDDNLKISFLGYNKNPIDYQYLNTELDECLKQLSMNVMNSSLSKNTSVSPD